MNRLERKCLVASLGMHGLLVCLLVFGSGFFVSQKQKAPSEFTRMKVVPTKFIDAAFSGGGGNPNLKPSDAIQKGSPTATPQPPQPQPPPQVKPPPQPAAQPKPKETVQPPRVTKKNAPLPLTPVKPADKMANDSILDDLKPIRRNDTDRSKARAKAEAEAQARMAREWAASNQKLAKQVGKAMEGVQRGFEHGTAVEASGPGGEAYMNYADYVRQRYEDAWVVSDMMMDEESTVRVTVTIRRSGQVISARIEKRSGNTTLDRSVQRALDKVEFIAPFPQDSKDEQRTFTINFNLKTKRLLG